MFAKLRRVHLLRVVIAALGFNLLSLPAKADERIGVTVNGNRETWRIDEPNVGQRLTEYPMIAFQAGDQVQVDAGGCVQTGGSGRTWKRYVDPQGPNADHLYHGLIEVPGATAPPGTLVRIAGVLGQTLTVNGPSSTKFHLTLGYEDDDYSDNGYWGHDDGTGDQCKDVGNAWVVVVIVHSVGGPPPPPPPAVMALPFNLDWHSEDPAFIPVDSLWGYQETHGFALPDPRPCLHVPHNFKNAGCSTDDPTTDTPELGDIAELTCNKNFPSIPGHVNWWASTYDGPVTWDGHAWPDDDYNFKLPSHLQFGEVTTNGGSLGVEFNSDETIDHFQTPWWSSFHQAVDQGDNAAAAMVNGKYAIITGLVGLDCEHDCPTELHPVFAMAIHVKDDPADDVWAIFARNWGNEGWCSQDQHYLDVNSIYFQLPWRAGASAVSALNAPDNSDRLFLTNDARVSGPFIQWSVNQGILVSFGLPSPDAGARLNGELHLQWTMPALSLRVGNKDIFRVGATDAKNNTGGIHISSSNAGVRRIQAAPPGPGGEKNVGGERGSNSAGAARGIHNVNQTGTMSAEEQLAVLYANLPEAQKKRIEGIRLTPIVHDAVPLRPFKVPIVRLMALPGRPLRRARPAMRTVHDAAKLVHDGVKLHALCDAYGGNLPGFPGACNRPAAPRIR